MGGNWTFLLERNTRGEGGYLLTWEGQGRMRVEDITDPDPSVRVVRAEGLLCALCFCQLPLAVKAL